MMPQRPQHRPPARNRPSSPRRPTSDAAANAPRPATRTRLRGPTAGARPGAVVARPWPRGGRAWRRRSLAGLPPPALTSTHGFGGASVEGAAWRVEPLCRSQRHQDRTGRPPPSKPARLRGHRARPGQPWAPSVLCRGGREARSRSGSAPFSKINRWKFLKSCLKVHNIVYPNISRPRENPTTENGEKARCVRRPRVDFGRLHAGPAFGRLGAAPPIPTRFAGPNIPSRRVQRGSARNITAAGRRRCSRRSPAATLRAPCLRRDDPPTQHQRPRRSTSRRGVGRPPDKPAGALRRPPVPDRRRGSTRCGRRRRRHSSAAR